MNNENKFYLLSNEAKETLESYGLVSRITKANITNILKDINFYIVNLNEATPRLILGPIKNYSKKGNLAKRSSTNNTSTDALAAEFVASITGVGSGKILSSYEELITALEALGVKNKYYTRQMYESKTGELYYYEYKYYSDSSYSKCIGKSYSFVYNNWT